MHLKSLELTGFKSFAEAKIEFPTGITSVVGPNGTGKSNIVDAILWVLGEQSAKTLRSERMEDVIFNGTETRKPLGMAEVSLIMGGVDEERMNAGLPHQLGDYQEVMITRRLYRNGESEYLINKTPCRLKDVRSMFLDSRAGTKGHTIIEQGRIEQILNASPQDRRELIEETAGIIRYKKQKAEALRKLESTQQNLLRVRDIIAEVKRQLNSLERQARQARSYQTLQQEARALEIRLLGRECRVLIDSRTKEEAELAELHAQEAGLAAEQSRLDGDIEAHKLRILEESQSVGRIREDLARVEHEQSQAIATAEVEKGRVSLYEQQHAQAREELTRLEVSREQNETAIRELRARICADESEVQAGMQVYTELESTERALAGRRAQVSEEEGRARQEIVAITIQATSGENRLASLDNQAGATARRLQRLATELAEIETQHAAAIERLAGTIADREAGERMVQNLRVQASGADQKTQRLAEHLREIDDAMVHKQQELAAVESRLRALQGVVREEMGYGREGEEEATSLRAACHGVHASVAEWLVVPPGLERAVEAILGERVRAWLVESPMQARRAIEFLNEKGLGRGAFVPLHPRYTDDPQAQPAKAWWPLLSGQPGIRGRAIDLVQVGSESHGVLACLFEGVVIVSSLEVAVEQWERGLWTAPDGPVLVTIDGEVMDAAGVITGGTAGTTGGLLLRRREIQRLEQERADVLRTLEEHRRNREQIAMQWQSERDSLRQLEEAIREADMSRLALTKDEATFRQIADDLARRLETIRAEREGDEQEQVGIDAERRSVGDEVTRWLDEKAVRESGLAELQTTLKEMEEETRRLQQQLTESQLSLASLRARLEHGRADLTRLIKEQDERTTRVDELNRQCVALEGAIGQSAQERDRNEVLVRQLDERAGEIRADLLSAQDRYTRDVERSQELEKKLAAVRSALTSSREARTAIEVRRAEIATQLSVRESTLEGTYQLTIQAALAQEPVEQQAWEGVRPDERAPVLADSGPAVETSSGAEMSEAPSGAEPHGADNDNGMIPADPSLDIRTQLQKVRSRLERLGPINLAAIEEHRELEERYRFLTTQENDLSQSVASLKEIIARINRTTKELFRETFDELQQKFGEVFGRFFPGGRAELVLIDPQPDPESGPGSEEPGVDIAAQPPGKRLKSIAMLSGGEKTLTAMALIFASFLIRPTPFCILDEIDAPLDEENIGRFAAVLRELSEGAQFVVITHNKRTMAVADSLFGVTMEEPGISKLVSVRLADFQPA
ncbi:MAG: chromosome segregation protein SMC [Nitrospiraceae bacterium]|nr:chromosome segregation protein SMC [Nitrospiraceae bacterium]